MDKVFFESSLNKKIFCYLSEPASHQKKIVIMSHGFRSSSIGPARTFVDFSRLLVSHGFSTFRFDQPNSGNSDGEYLQSSFNEWVDTIVYFSKRFINSGYKVALLGQSMGAAASVVASAREELKGEIVCLLLWVPGPVLVFNKPANKIYEEEGEKYRGTFWLEAKKADFMGCLRKFKGKMHLVYGEDDRYVSKKSRDEVIAEVKKKGQKVMILKGQNHSPWKYDMAQEVYQEELKIIQDCFGS